MVESDADGFKVRVEDGNSKFREIFKPDYAKTRDLESGKVRLTNWHLYAFRKLKHLLEKNNIQQCGKNYIRRRVIIHGLGEIEKDNEKVVVAAKQKYEKSLEYYDRRRNQQSKKGRIIGDIDGDRTTFYMDETDFGRLQELADILGITTDSITRIAIAYTIIDLEDFFGTEIIEEAGRDINEFKEACKHVAL